MYWWPFPGGNLPTPISRDHRHGSDGIDGNGGKGGFNEEEVEQMRGALIDLSNRIRRAAENI